MLRHFGGWYTRLLIGSLTADIGADGVDRVLKLAGDDRSPAELRSDATWSSYDQFRRLLEAAAEVSGGVDTLTAAGSRIAELSDINRSDAVRTLGSPDAMYANMPVAASSVCAILLTESRKTGEREWLLRQRFADGFDAFPEFCAFQRGVHKISPFVFGYLVVRVDEEACVLRGDDRCAFRVRWEPVAEWERDAELLRRDVQALERQLEQFQRTVSDLVSGDDLQLVLDRTFEAASHAVRAPKFALVLADTPIMTVRPLYVSGLATDEISAVAEQLCATPHGVSGSWLVADVRSPRREYGKLAAIRPDSGFLPHELPRLEAYAGFIAASLDSAWSLTEARRQSETTRALLELSTALADITTVEEMAAKLVRAVSGVMGSERAAVLLRTAQGDSARIAATYGYTAEVDALLKQRRYDVPAARADEPCFRLLSDLDPTSSTAAWMAEAGTTAHIKIPIFVDGQWGGEIFASTPGDPERLGTDDDSRVRLRGLAAQAATAIRNAQLLDQVRYQAYHDALTGLPNRALILDRVGQLLTRGRRGTCTCAVMFIDLDGFKEINDTFGHAAGDELLCAVTARLTPIVRPADTVGRLGGDEFVIVLDGTTGETDPAPVADRVLAALRAPFDIRERDAGWLTVTASVGIAVGERLDPADLLRDADIALYQAKAAGKDCFVVFGADDNAPARVSVDASR